MATKITDLIDPAEIEKLKQLDDELRKVLTTYTGVAKDLAKGLEVNVTVVGDIDKLENILVNKGKEAANVQQQLTKVIEEQSKVVANTTNTISRQLMEQERVNKTQRDAYTEYDRVKKLLEQYHDTYDGQISRLVKLNTELEANKKAQKENEKALSAGKTSMADYQAKQAELIAQHRALTQEKRTLNQIMTAEEKANQSQEGSYAQLSQQLELLKKAYKDLDEEGRTSEFGKELEISIQNLDAHLKDMAADMGEFQRNVGNYAIANGDLKKKYDELVGTLAGLQSQYAKLSDEEKNAEDGQKLANSIKEVSEAAKETKQSIEEHNEALEDARRSLGETGGKTSSVKRDLKELVLEIANLTIEYQNLSAEEQASAEGQELAEHIRELTEQAGVLKDAIADTNQAISNAASDTRSFDQLGGAIQLAIDGFGLAQGAAAMLGISEKELAEIQTKLQAAIAASNAMQSIQNALQGQSAVMQGAALIQTKLRTVAENLHTAAQGRGVVATTALTAAQWAFNAAANANPIGLVVVAIVACVAAVWGLVKAFQAIFGPSEEAYESFQKNKEALDEMCDTNDRLIDRMKARGATEAELLNQSLQNKQAEKEAADALFQQACELYDEDEDEYKEALEAKKKADEDFNAAKEDGLNYLEKIQAEVYAYERENAIGTHAYKLEIIEAEKKKQLELAELLYKTGEKTREQYELIVASVNKLAEIKTDKLNKDEQKAKSSKASTPRRSTGGSRANDAQKQAEDLKKAVQAGEDSLLQIIEDSLQRQRQAELLSYSRRLKELQEKLNKTKDKEVSMRKAINNQILGLQAEHARKLEEIELSMIERRQKANADFIDLRLEGVKEGTEEEYKLIKEKLENQRNMEYHTIAKAERDKTITVEKALEMRAALVEKYAKLETKALEEQTRKQMETIQKRYADQSEETNTDAIVALNSLKSRYISQMKAAKGNVREQTKLKEDFERESVELQEKYALESANAAVQLLEEQLKNETLTEEEREELYRKLARARAMYAQQATDIEIGQMDRALAKQKEANQKRIESIENWKQISTEALNSINDLVSKVYDGKAQKVEEELEANTAAGEAEQERIAKMVEQNVITEEEGEARKRAAEEKTARKNEELEKKKAEIKRKQAVFDKAVSVANVGIDLAAALMKLWVEPGWPAAIPMMAVVSALGALQLATILATPIPKYAKGTDHHKGGPAIVGDGGVPELVIFGGKSWVTPDKPTLVDMPAGAVVRPTIDGIGPDLAGYIPTPASQTNNSPVIVNNNYKRLEEKMDTFISVMRKHSNRQHRAAVENSLNRYISERI